MSTFLKSKLQKFKLYEAMDENSLLIMYENKLKCRMEIIIFNRYT